LVISLNKKFSKKEICQIMGEYLYRLDIQTEIDYDFNDNSLFQQGVTYYPFLNVMKKIYVKGQLQPILPLSNNEIKNIMSNSNFQNLQKVYNKYFLLTENPLNFFNFIDQFQIYTDWIIAQLNEGETKPVIFETLEEVFPNDNFKLQRKLVLEIAQKMKKKKQKI
jgi:hypothetical protein